MLDCAIASGCPVPGGRLISGPAAELADGRPAAFGLPPAICRNLLELLGGVSDGRPGVLITLAEPSPGVLDAVDHGGTYTWPLNNQSYPRVQVITIKQLLAGARPKMPPPLLPYIQAARARAPSTQPSFDDLAAESG